MLMKPIPNGWVVFTWIDVEDEVNSAFIEVVGIYTDKNRAQNLASSLGKLPNIEAWAEPAPVDRTPIRLKLVDRYEISGRGTTFTGDVVIGSGNDVKPGMILHHHNASELRINSVEKLRNSPSLGLLVSGSEAWDKDIPIEGMICTVKEMP